MIKSSLVSTVICITIQFFSSFCTPVSAIGQYGAPAEEIGQCSIKSCFINILMVYKSEILKQEKSSNGTFSEIYKVQRESGLNLKDYIKIVVSSGRPGLWDVVSTPIQGYSSDDMHIIFKATYNDKEQATSIDIQSPELDH